MSILSLSNEILSEISDLLEDLPDIRALANTSRRFRSISLTVPAVVSLSVGAGDKSLLYDLCTKEMPISLQKWKHLVLVDLHRRLDSGMPMLPHPRSIARYYLAWDTALDFAHAHSAIIVAQDEYYKAQKHVKEVKAAYKYSNEDRDHPWAALQDKFAALEAHAVALAEWATVTRDRGGIRNDLIMLVEQPSVRFDDCLSRIALHNRDQDGLASESRALLLASE